LQAVLTTLVKSLWLRHRDREREKRERERGWMCRMQAIRS